MDLSSPTPTTNSPLVPVFGGNVQDLLGTGVLNANPTGSIIVVNSTDDTVDDPNSGVTTLRDAINQANANADAGEDLIVFDRSLFSNQQTITLNMGELDITHNLSIIAPRDPVTGGDLVTVSGNNAMRVFEIETGATVSIDGLIVADGSATNDDGGGIKNSGTLTLDSSIVCNNSAKLSNSSIFGYGGGISNTGTLNVFNSTISGNSAFSGGGIVNSNGTNIVRVSNSTISGNSVASSGGGIYNARGIVQVSNSTISGNTADFGIFNGIGGGIDNLSTMTVSNSTISGNRIKSNPYGGGDGGGINNTGDLTLSNSTISGNSASGFLGSGGGISNTSTLNVINSTISDNSANGVGGGIDTAALRSTTNVRNSTITGNSALLRGGGINTDNFNTLTLVFSTLTLNSAANGGGVYNSNLPNSTVLPDSVSVRNTIIAGNHPTADGVNPDVFGTFTSNGYNMIGNSTGSTGFGATGDVVGTSDRPIDPRLAPLDFYGGPTQTIALLSDSPAIDAADPTILDTDPTTDQRGLPRVSNGRADIGAFEAQEQ